MNSIFHKANLPLIIAHRGESIDAPENTLAAVNLAWARGADAIEIDTHLTKDNHIVAIHNRRTKITSGSGRMVKSQTLHHLKKLDVGKFVNRKWITQNIPTLTDVLETIPHGKFIFIEIKCGVEIIPHLKNVLAESTLNHNQIKLIGFGINKMKIIKMNFPEYEVFLNRMIIFRKVFSGNAYWDNLIDEVMSSSLNGLNLYNNKFVNKKLIEKLKLNKLKIFVWTVNNPRKALHLINLGIDGLMSDYTGIIKNKLSLQ
jgi:glycerophosphoryl diester phosphodiesterase